MVDVIDLKAEFEKLTMLTGRTPTSTEGERAKAFGRVAQYRDGTIFTIHREVRRQERVGTASSGGRDRADCRWCNDVAPDHRRGTTVAKSTCGDDGDRAAQRL